MIELTGPRHHDNAAPAVTAKRITAAAVRNLLPPVREEEQPANAMANLPISANRSSGAVVLGYDSAIHLVGSQ